MRKSAIYAWSERTLGSTPRRAPIVETKRARVAVATPSTSPSTPPIPPATRLSLKLKSTAPSPAAISPPPPSPKQRQDHAATLAVLRAAYPQAFREPRPLAIGAGKIILGDASLAISRHKIRAALRWWTSGPIYLAAVAREGSMRIGLDGAEAEPVSAEHRADARRRLDELKARRDASA